MRETYRHFDLTRGAPWFMALLALALVAFWPSYLALLPGGIDAFTHAHALTATLWVLLLIVQPYAIRTRRRALHRTLGRTSYVLGPLVLASILLLAHSRMQSLQGQAYAIQTYVLYVQLSLAALFALCFGLAIYTRHRMALHARFMVCTALTLIDPVVIRLMFWVNPVSTWNYQWFTFGLTDLILVVLIWLERRSPTGRSVFPAMLAAFVLAQIPALFGLTNSEGWQAFARWFAALPSGTVT